MRWLLKRSPKDDSIVANYWTRLRRGGSEVFRCCIVQFIAKIAKNCILILTSIFVFIPPSSERFIELSIWMSAPSLSSPSASGGKQLLQTQQTSTRPPNRLWAAIKYLLEHYVWLQSHYGTFGQRVEGTSVETNIYCRRKVLGCLSSLSLRHCSQEIVLVHKVSLILLRLPSLWGIYWAKGSIINYNQCSSVTW